MIEQEVREIVRKTEDSGERLNSLADQFRGGRDVRDILALLDSPDAELVSIGAWVLSELPLSLYNSRLFVSRLRRLVDHQAPAVRFHAFAALFPALNWHDETAQALLAKLRIDPNEGVRRSAEAAAVRVLQNR